MARARVLAWALTALALAGCAHFGVPGPLDARACKEQGCFWDAAQARCDCMPGARRGEVPGKLEGQ